MRQPKYHSSGTTRFQITFAYILFTDFCLRIYTTAV